MKGFVSYSHYDREICELLKLPLRAICRGFGIDEFWIDTNTTTGRCFRDGYSEAIDEASIFVLVISSNSIWSDEIMEHEIPKINIRARSCDGLILPVVVDDCFWRLVVGTTLASPRDVNYNLRPIRKWRPMRDGINQAGLQFADAIARHFGIKPKQLFDWSGS